MPGGRAGIVSGAFSVALICTVLQLVVNEAAVVRVKYVSARSGVLDMSETRHHAQSPTSERTSDTGAWEREVAPSALPKHNLASAPASLPPSIQAPISFGDRVLRAIGMKRLSDNEYLDVLKHQREGYLRKIQELEESERTSQEQKSI